MKQLTFTIISLATLFSLAYGQPDEEEMLMLRELWSHYETMPESCTLPPPDDYRVKYSVSSCSEYFRIIPSGAWKKGDNPSIMPKAGNHVNIFYYDQGGRVIYMASRSPGPDSKSCIRRHVLYDSDGSPFASLNYTAEGKLWGSDYVYHKEKKPVLSCRILPDRKAVLISRISGDGKIETPGRTIDLDELFPVPQDSASDEDACTDNGAGRGY